MSPRPATSHKATSHKLETAGLGAILALCLLFVGWPHCLAAERTDDNPAEWTFVSFPDFFNFDVPHPWPQWDPAVNWFLDQVEAERPEFVLVAGDLVNAHWWDGPRCIEQMGALYYGGWKRRMREHDLTYYVAIGDHELGDDPWPEKKLRLVPHFERVFVEQMDMPRNGPDDRKGLAYYVRHNNVLVITVETFEQHDGRIRPTVSGSQLAWFNRVIRDHRDKVNFIVVQGHVPVFGPVKSRSSSRIMLADGRENPFWQAMKDGGVDVYLCGEHHDVTVGESDGIWQIVHGSSWGRKVVNTMDYLVLRASPKRLHLEMKSFPMHAKGDHMWNLHKSRGPREIVEIPDDVKQSGPKITGTMTIDKSTGEKTFADRSGIFE